MIIGERIILREIEEDDLNSIVKWRNDPDILRWLFSYSPLNKTKQIRWYEKYLDDYTQQTFIIEVKEEKIPIGTVGLTSIDYKNQIAELGVLIGDEGWQNKGMGKEALDLLIRFVFDEMNIRKIKATVFEENIPAIRLYKSCGFVEEGALQKEVYKNGEFKSVMVMALFK
jgi:UDP-4-amino-4,6-dideoxy-N-acetyl-beta-L-altrosamine N-acetyltransferase